MESDHKFVRFRPALIFGVLHRVCEILPPEAILVFAFESNVDTLDLHRRVGRRFVRVLGHEKAQFFVRGVRFDVNDVRQTDGRLGRGSIEFSEGQLPFREAQSFLKKQRL